MQFVLWDLNRLHYCCSVSALQNNHIFYILVEILLFILLYLSLRIPNIFNRGSYLQLILYPLQMIRVVTKTGLGFNLQECIRFVSRNIYSWYSASNINNSMLLFEGEINYILACLTDKVGTTYVIISIASFRSIPLFPMSARMRTLATKRSPPVSKCIFRPTETPSL